ncbi:hypothetical protein ACIPJM_17550 [Streptomyces halstedii]|uniref:hypothetical protein n=1 Tax=Streptomyces halstedii TaxID=1944 RepID=UPI0037F7A7DC
MSAEERQEVEEASAVLRKARAGRGIRELNQANAELKALLNAKTSEADALASRVTELEDELTAARTSLRQMIRDHSRGTLPT